MADASSRIGNAAFQLGATYRVTGFVGQRATRSGALDGYRVWVRDPADVIVVTAATASPGTTPGSGSPAPGATTIATISIARALKITDRPVAIDAIVTAPATLLDASGRRIVAQDASAAVELLLPTGSAAPPVGARIHAEGRIGVAYGAPRLRVDRFTVAGSGPVPAPLDPPRCARGCPRMAPRVRHRPGAERPQARRPMASRDRRRQGPGGGRRPAGSRDREHDADRRSQRDGRRDRATAGPDSLGSPLRRDPALPGGPACVRTARSRVNSWLRRDHAAQNGSAATLGDGHGPRLRVSRRRRRPRRTRAVRGQAGPRRRPRRRPAHRWLHAR